MHVYADHLSFLRVVQRVNEAIASIKGYPYLLMPSRLDPASQEHLYEFLLFDNAAEILLPVAENRNRQLCIPVVTQSVGNLRKDRLHVLLRRRPVSMVSGKLSLGCLHGYYTCLAQVALWFFHCGNVNRCWCAMGYLMRWFVNT